MKFAYWKRWQWIALGLVLGGLVGLVRSSLGPGFDTDIHDTLNQPVFEDYLLRGRVGNKDVIEVKNLVVHPPFDETAIDWVTGVAVLQYNAPENPRDPASPLKRWQEVEPFRFSTHVLYDRFGERNLAMGKPPEGSTNRDYLQRLANEYPERGIHFRYAWWDAPRMQLYLWLAGGLLVFGLILPTIIHLIAPVPKDESGVDLRKIRSSKPTPHPVPAGLSAADEDQLAAVEAELERKLAAAMDDDDAPVARDAPKAPVAIRKLDAGPLEASKTAPTASDEPREFGGEYYPTVAHAPKSKNAKP